MEGGLVDLLGSQMVWPAPTIRSNSSKAATMTGIASPSKVISYVLRGITIVRLGHDAVIPFSMRAAVAPVVTLDRVR